MNKRIGNLTPTATELIRADHRHLIEAFHAIGPDSSASTQDAVAREICAALEVHTQLEEELFYPVLRDARIELPSVASSASEHNEMRDHIARVRSLHGGDPSHPHALLDLMRCVLHHIADEETILLPAAEQTLGAQLQAMGAQMAERRVELSKLHPSEITMAWGHTSPGRATLMTLGALTAGALLIHRFRRDQSLGLH